MKTVTINTAEYALTQNAYISDSGKTYQAHAVDSIGSEYMIYWDVVDAETDDQSSACNWSQPSDVVAL